MNSLGVEKGKVRKPDLLLPSPIEEDQEWLHKVFTCVFNSFIVITYL